VGIRTTRLLSMQMYAGLGVDSRPKVVLWNGSSTIDVPAGMSAGKITNLNDLGADVTYTVAGTDATITGGAESGQKLLITP